MRMMPLFLGALLVTPLVAVAEEEIPAPKSKKPNDYAEFSKLVHGFVAPHVKKQFEHRDGWGNTIPLPETKLRLPNLRTYLKVGDELVLPHGAWKKLKVRIDDPAKDIQIQVKEFKPQGDKSYRLVLEADVVLATQGEWQQWQKGLLLIGVAGEADAFLKVTVGCDVGVSLNLNKLPPEVNVSPKVTDLALDLKDIRPRGGPILSGEKGEKLAADIKGLLRSAVKLAEPQVKDLANEAIAQSLKNGKGTLSAGALLKALPTK
jgi:hypothetical protein